MIKYDGLCPYCREALAQSTHTKSNGGETVVSCDDCQLQWRLSEVPEDHETMYLTMHLDEEWVMDSLVVMRSQIASLMNSVLPFKHHGIPTVPDMGEIDPPTQEPNG